MRLLIFGTGGFYRYWKMRLHEILGEDEIVAFVDNRAKDKRYFEGMDVYLPHEILLLEFDRILLMSEYEREMQEQLQTLGVSDAKICFFDQYISEKSHGSVHLYIGDVYRGEKRVLLMTNDLGYHGSAVALIRAAEALKRKKYEILIVASRGDEGFVKEIVSIGLNVMICPALPFIEKEEWFWIEKYDVVLVNTFPMIQAAYEIARRKPVLWWMHESRHTYEAVLYRCSNYLKAEMPNFLHIFTVSEPAKRNFESYWPLKVEKLLPYGIPDEYSVGTRKKTSVFVFALIGTFIPIKAQDIFLKAIIEMTKEVDEDIEFWLIGNCDKDPYCVEVLRMAQSIPQVKILGVLNRIEMKRVYSDIDVLVCPSIEDSLPIVVAEAMMNCKICIVTRAVGTSRYIQDGENGFICETSSVESLCQKMKWVFYHRENLQNVKRNARVTYEKYFSMNSFGERLNEIISNISTIC